MSSQGADDASIAPTTSTAEDFMASVPPHTASDSSPFLLKAQDAQVLAQSDGFNILRQHLSETYSDDLCDNHKPAESENLPRWLLVRDVFHALLVPIVELFDKAVNLAVPATDATKVEDLEYAFSGQARSAFLWLQCFLSNETEREWCYTRGCPACVVEHSLDSEFSVRLLYSACLLSDVHYPFTLEGPTLPSFIFFLDSLERALSVDPLYGNDFFEHIQPKAVATRNGIEELIRHCVELENMLSQPSSPSDSAAVSLTPSPVLGPLGAASSTSGITIMRGKIAQRQMSLQIEEEQWMEEMLKRCWEQLPPAGGAAMNSNPAHAMDAAVNTINEVEPVR